MVCRTILLISLIPLVCEALPSAPGYSVRIPRAGIDVFIDDVAKDAEVHATKMPTPDLDATVSGVDLEFGGVRISKFERPRITYTLQGPNKFFAVVNVPWIDIKGHVHATRRTYFTTQKDEGDVEFTVTNNRVGLSLTTDTFENGPPKVGQVECQSSLGPGKVNALNFREKFATDVLALNAKPLWAVFNAQLCAILKKTLTENANKVLSQFPSVFEFSKDVSLKGKITLATTNDSLQVSFFENATTGFVSPWSPVKCDMNVNGSPQAIVTASDVMFNSLLYQAYKNGLLNFTVSPSSPPTLYQTLSLDCGKSGACLGNVDKKLPERFGKDALVEVQMKASVGPTIEFKNGSAAMTAGWRATVYITPNQKSAKRTLVASSDVTVSGSLQVKVLNATAYAKVAIEDIKLKVDQPEFQHWQQDAKSLFKDMVQKHVNGEFLLKGMPLPSGLKVEDASVKFSKHCVQATGSWNAKAAVSSEGGSK